MGSYQDGIFKFIMKIPENFPDGDCPVSIYSTKLENGKLGTNKNKINIHEYDPSQKGIKCN